MINDTLICACGVARATCPYHHVDSDSFRTIATIELSTNSELAPKHAAWILAKTEYEKARARVREVYAMSRQACEAEKLAYDAAYKARSEMNDELRRMYDMELPHTEGGRY